MKQAQLAALFVGLAIAIPSADCPAQGKRELDAVQKIKDWGYAIRPIKGWNSIPAAAGEKFIVGRWKLNIDDLWLRGDYEGWSGGQHCELMIVRIPLLAAPTGTAPADEKPVEGAEDLPPLPIASITSTSFLKVCGATL